MEIIFTIIVRTCTCCMIGFFEVSGVGAHSYQVVETILCYRLK